MYFFALLKVIKNKNYLLRDTLFYAIVRGVALLFSLVISILISRNTSPDIFNSFAFIERLISIGVVLFLFGGRQTILVTKKNIMHFDFNILIQNRLLIFIIIVQIRNRRPSLILVIP